MSAELTDQMTREERIVETFVELAEMMVEDLDVVEFLHGLTLRCVDLLDCAEAGLLLADAAGGLQVMASSSERVAALEFLQSQDAEGPCFECYHRGETVFSEDFEADRGRWPTFAPAALEKGFRSVQAVPLRARGQTIGAVNLFRATTGRVVDVDLRVAQGLAGIAAAVLLQQRELRESRDLAEQLRGALSSRIVIEQAKGALAHQARIDVDAAFGRLRAYARAHNCRLSDLARELLDGQLDVSTLAGPTQNPSALPNQRP